MNRLIALCALSALLASTASAEEVGRWCDIPVPGMAALDGLMVLKAKGGSTYSLHITYGDKSERTITLEKSGSRYRDLEGGFGEYYSVRSNGQLGIYDSEGFIRAARSASGAMRPRDCR